MQRLTKSLAFRAAARRSFASSAPGDSLAFARIASSRRSAHAFDASRAVPRAALRRVLASTLRTPTGFNLAPFRLVLVHDGGVEPLVAPGAAPGEEDGNDGGGGGSGGDLEGFDALFDGAAAAGNRARLAACMVGGGNAERVLEAPLSVVFLADLEPARGVPALVARELAAGTRSRQYLRALPFNVAVFAGGSAGGAEEAAAAEAAAAAAGADGGGSGSSFGPGPGPGSGFGSGFRPGSGGCASGAGGAVAAAAGLGRAAVGAALGLGSRLAPLPALGSAEAWSFKQSGLAAMSLMLAAAAEGLGSHAMEGLDARRVREALGAPARGWGVPLVVSLGFARASAHPAAALRSARPTLRELVSSNRFGAAAR
jgi:nitroreductase